MSNQGEDSQGSFAFIMVTFGAPFCIFALGFYFSSMHFNCALWKPFWKRHTNKVQGRICGRVRVKTTGMYNDGITRTRESKHVIIHYNVNGIRMQRTFDVVMSEGEWRYDGRPHIGSISLETSNVVNNLTLRLIPSIPESAFPELEWEIQQRPHPWYVYAFALFMIAAVSYWLGFWVPDIEDDKWRKRTSVVFVALYVTIWPVAYIMARRVALAQMKRQETTEDFTTPFDSWGALFHSTNLDNEGNEHVSNLQLQSLDTATSYDDTTIDDTIYDDIDSNNNNNQ